MRPRFGNSSPPPFDLRRLDILHNNAAALDPDLAPLDGDIEHMQTAVWDRTFTVNLRGTMMLCREALPHLRAAGNGAIVNTVSNSRCRAI